MFWLAKCNLNLNKNAKIKEWICFYDSYSIFITPIFEANRQKNKDLVANIIKKPRITEYWITDLVATTFQFLSSRSKILSDLRDWIEEDFFDDTVNNNNKKSLSFSSSKPSTTVCSSQIGKEDDVDDEIDDDGDHFDEYG